MNLTLGIPTQFRKFQVWEKQRYCKSDYGYCKSDYGLRRLRRQIATFPRRFSSAIWRGCTSNIGMGDILIGSEVGSASGPHNLEIWEGGLTPYSGAGIGGRPPAKFSRLSTPLADPTSEIWGGVVYPLFRHRNKG